MLERDDYIVPVGGEIKTVASRVKTHGTCGICNFLCVTAPEAAIALDHVAK